MLPAKEIEKALFDAASNLPDAEVRRAFLEQACGGDAVLKRRIEELLAADQAAATFFEFQPHDLAADPPPNDGCPLPVEESVPEDPLPSFEKINAWIGPYKLLERIGEGGCGVVYLAEQREPMQRRVALKIIRLGMDTERVIARFEMERQALAMMSHPNIAQVLDAGCTETGRPFFAMELVPGVRITDYCDEHRLDLAKRLELFGQVCLAIQHAHQKGILHRDIKPSNVLVTMHDGVAVPKVIDFGIAKAVEGQGLGTRSVTAYEQLIGTPAYMSPEQAARGGVDVDTRTDIYSLGILLYELLAGRPPFDTDELVGLGLDGMMQALREREPLPPSKMVLSLEPADLERVAAARRCEPARLAGLLRGDLDWIVLKALEKDRQRRYATANGFAIDVQRHLRYEPVAARPPSRIYWFRKLVRRNRAVFAAVAAVAGALFLGLGTSTWLFLREREVRRQQAVLLARAEESEKITRAVFLVREGKFPEANELLEQINGVPSRPSLDGVSVYRAVGDWLAIQQRWPEAAQRYSVVLHLDRLDVWSPVTLDYQAYGALLVETGNFPEYGQFCRDAATRYAAEKNGDAACRILKSCLLRPSDRDLLTALQPIGATAGSWFANNAKNPWASIPLGLWHYRRGEYRQAAEIASIPARNERSDSAAFAAKCAIHGLALFREGQTEKARWVINQGSEIVNRVFETRAIAGDGARGFWYDWVFARILLNEAAEMLREPPKS